MPYMNDMIIDELYGLEIGGNYLFRYKPSVYEDSYLIKPLYDGGPLYEKINNIDEFNLDDPKWQKMKDDMELLDINTRSFNINTSKNMESHPYTQEYIGAYTLIDGRWINYDDYKNSNKVCVVGRHLFKTRNLNLGDKIPIQYMETESEFPGYLMTEKDRKEWKNYHKSDAIEYEIVGVYDEFNSGRDIYVPTSTVPEEFLKFPEPPSEDGMPYLWTQLFHFVLKNPTEQSQFIEKYSDPIRKNPGFELQFVDNNAETFWISANQVSNNLIINTVVYGLLLLFAMIFSIYICIWKSIRIVML